MAKNLDLLLELGFRFNPSPEDVVTYYLPRLIAGVQPKDTKACIHRANVYGAEPKDLAGDFAPVTRSSNGDRFFFTECKRNKGRVSRAAGGGTWVSQSSKDIKNSQGIKIGETKNFRFKKDGNNTDWHMEEYHLCVQEAGDLEPVVCRMNPPLCRAKNPRRCRVLHRRRVKNPPLSRAKNPRHRRVLHQRRVKYQPLCRLKNSRCHAKSP
ncbi:hypothetical protein E2562_001447 [Oryza meyeriana var. granulata]|uniref:NAC domain-containing protein n=1 Tax=Oryza meyeriana var. granulata TaxID=110450 RepID=A0A6G1DCV0_9ORYZ|nr:hypothetical protein E2562_001447 [Oryza meyeriana var. granulata]